MAQTFQGGAAANYAREMERLSANESLLLAVSSLLFSVPRLVLLADLPVRCLREALVPTPYQIVGDTVKF